MRDGQRLFDGFTAPVVIADTIPQSNSVNFLDGVLSICRSMAEFKSNPNDFTALTISFISVVTSPKSLYFENISNVLYKGSLELEIVAM